MAAAALLARDELVERAAAGERRSLARLLSLLERGGEPELAASLHGRGAEPYAVGLTGAPGAGKSTLVDGLVATLRERGERCAVLAVDPSSPFSGGAILGDRVRLHAEHAEDDAVFVRSFANRGRLGGLAEALPSAIRALGLGGWPTVLIETVGVGQAEVDVAAWADTTVVVLTPGWGDEIQANKSGLLEIADVFVVNKADRKGVGLVEADLARMLDLSAPAAWRAPILATVATDRDGVAAVWDAVAAHRQQLEASGELDRRRRQRRLGEARRELADAIGREVAAVEDSAAGRAIRRDLEAGELAPAAAARELLELALERSGG